MADLNKLENVKGATGSPNHSDAFAGIAADAYTKSSLRAAGAGKGSGDQASNPGTPAPMPDADGYVVSRKRESNPPTQPDGTLRSRTDDPKKLPTDLHTPPKDDPKKLPTDLHTPPKDDPKKLPPDLHTLTKDDPKKLPPDLHTPTKDDPKKLPTDLPSPELPKFPKPNGGVPSSDVDVVPAPKPVVQDGGQWPGIGKGTLPGLSIVGHDLQQKGQPEKRPADLPDFPPKPQPPNDWPRWGEGNQIEQPKGQNPVKNPAHRIDLNNLQSPKGTGHPELYPHPSHQLAKPRFHGHILQGINQPELPPDWPQKM